MSDFKNKMGREIYTFCLHNKCADIKVHVGFTKIFVYSSYLNIKGQINIEIVSQW